MKTTGQVLLLAVTLIAPVVAAAATLTVIDCGDSGGARSTPHADR